MAEFYEERTRTVTEKVHIKTTCDICGEQAKAKGPRGEWEDDSFGVASTAISIEEGESYPEGGHVIKDEYDICPKCFKTVLMPFLESRGANPRRERVEF